MEALLFLLIPVIVNSLSPLVAVVIARSDSKIDLDRLDRATAALSRFKLAQNLPSWLRRERTPPPEDDG